jgi:succinyl-diaminopimelate desuccinylase
MADVADQQIHQATLDLAKALIRRRSVTPDDAGCLDVIARRLAAVGFHCQRIDRGGVANLWARHGDQAPLVCLAGHVDVVPPGPVDQWTSDPFDPVERDGRLFGRGAADMKVSVAAMVTAIERVVTAHPSHPGSVALLLTSDEEGTAVDGTAAVVEWLRAERTRIDACIVGEPTSDERFGDTIKNGRRGSLNGHLVVRGVQCHIAYPERGSNPIQQALPALAELVATSWDRGNVHFPPTSFQVSNIHAGTGVVNVTPGSLDVRFNFRFSNELTSDGIRQRVHDVLTRHGLDFDLEWTVSGEPFVTEPGTLVGAISRAIRDVSGALPGLSTSGGTSDGRFLAAVAHEIVEFGPLNASIHKVDEHVRLADIAPLSRIYERTVETLMGLEPRG